MKLCKCGHPKDNHGVIGCRGCKCKSFDAASNGIWKCFLGFHLDGVRGICMKHDYCWRCPRCGEHV